MHRKRRHIVSSLPRLFFTLSLGLASACGATAPTAGTGTNVDAGDAGPPSTAFTVRASSAEVVSGGHTTLSAVDSDGNPVAVTWAPPAKRGTVDDSKVYTAPILFSAEDVSIVATRVDHPEATAAVSVHVLSVLPVMTSSGGPVLANPVFTAISFADDADAALGETVVSKLGAGSYWATVTKEYGVGPATATVPVRLTDKAPSVTNDDEIGAWLADRLDGTHPEFPAPKDGSAYLISYPPTSTITFKGDQSCKFFSAYHSETKVAGKSVPYVVGAHCSGLRPDDFNYAISEDLIEATLDPFRFTAPAYAMSDSGHLVWNFLREGEAAGLCQLRLHGTAPTTDLGFATPLIWSNSAAATGHEPCVPASGHELVAAFPILEEDVPMAMPASYDTPSGIRGTTKGIRIPVGKTKTIDVVVYSDGPADAQHSFMFQGFTDPSGQPFFSGDLSPTSGKSGDHLTLTLKTLRADPTYGGEPFILTEENSAANPTAGTSTIGLVRISP